MKNARLLEGYDPSALARVAAGTEIVVDERSGTSVVLVAKRGRYIRLGREATSALRTLASKVDGETVANVSPGLGGMSLLELADAGVVEVVPIEGRRIRLLLLAEFVVLNLATRIVLRIFGWRIIRLVRAPRGSREGDGADASLVEDLLAATRWGCASPGSSTQCLTLALTTHLMLRRRRVSSRLVVAAQPEAFEPHAWIESGSHRIDTSAASAWMIPFAPLVKEA